MSSPSDAVAVVLNDPSIDWDELRPRPWFEAQRIASFMTFNRCIRAGQLPRRKVKGVYYWSLREVMDALADTEGRRPEALQAWAEAEARKSPPVSPESAAVVRSEFAAAGGGSK